MPYKTVKTKCTCLQCGDTINYGRYDRKFCSDHCRNKYHNAKRAQIRRYRLKVFNTLERNHDILEHLLGLGCHSMGKLELADMGYDCTVVSSFCKHTRDLECRCYNIRYNDRPGKITDLSYIPEVPEEVTEEDIVDEQ